MRFPTFALAAWLALSGATTSGLSAEPTPASPPAEAPAATRTVSYAELGGQLRFPATFQPAPERMREKARYFYFRGDRLLLSGWLQPRADYRGFQTFWDEESTTLKTKLGAMLSREEIKEINGWKVAEYTAMLPAVTAAQRNLRACRVVGDTWADIHLSSMVPQDNYADLEAVLRTIVLEPKR